MADVERHVVDGDERAVRLAEAGNVDDSSRDVDQFTCWGALRRPSALLHPSSEKELRARDLSADRRGRQVERSGDFFFC
jgi:hypothetical protein